MKEDPIGRVLTHGMPQNPVIVLGMHRSGTTLVAQILASFGVFLGHRLDPNHEAQWFLDTNDWLLSLAHAAWDHPSPFRRLLADQDLCQLLIRRLGREVRSRSFARSFLGYRRLSPRRDASSALWGWKDPRNTLTFPLWAQVYGQPRCILVCRRGTEVAQSLATRAAANYARAKKGKLADWEWRFTSLRCRKPREAFSLWEEYYAMLFEREDQLHRHALLSLCFEDLLEHPRPVVSDIARFIGVTVSSEQLDRAASLVDPSIQRNEKPPPELLACLGASEVAERLGYDPQGERDE